MGETDLCFRLTEDSWLIRGASRGALYDLASGNVYSINHVARNALDLLEGGQSISQVLAATPEITREELVSYLQSLEDLSLGRFVAEPGQPREPLCAPVFHLNLVWLELTEGCNLRCVHCYADSSPEKKRVDSLSHEDWLRVIAEAHELGSRRLQFIGGEPFAYGDRLFHLAEYARSLGYDLIEVFTNGTLLNDNRIRNLKELGMCVAVSFYGNDAQIHDAITQRRGSFTKTLAGIKKLHAAEVPTRVAVIAMRANEHVLHETIELIKQEAGVEDIGYDVVRPSGRGCSSELASESLIQAHLLAEPRFPKVKREEFLKRRFGHNCFADELCITATGDVFPCIMERDIILGNVQMAPLPAIVQDF
jgi:MoaA/NifB/PqqE/SkfB family radical SAM enzyme